MSEIRIENCDCLEFLGKLADNSIDGGVTDPPYGMSSHSQADIVAALTAWLAGKEYVHNKKGFMGKEWDSFVPSPTVWREVLRVLKPGGYILCAASTRTSDLMGISLRLAGFEIRDTIEWIYGSGFPKSLDISKAIDKEAGYERKVIEIIKKTSFGGGNNTNIGYKRPSDKNTMKITTPSTELAKKFEGFGTALKPAHEPFILARKPIEKGLTVAENCLKWGTGGLDIDSCRVETNDDTGRTRNGKTGICYSALGGIITQSHINGRFPTNVIHDGSDCVINQFPNSISTGGINGKRNNDYMGLTKGYVESDGLGGYGDQGSAARFFYCAKASQSERNAGLDSFEEKQTRTTYDKSVRDKHGNDSGHSRKNIHPTVKPLNLMKYLIQLISKKGDAIIDPFLGSGTTGLAACEIFKDYFDIAKTRLATKSQPLDSTNKNTTENSLF